MNWYSYCGGNPVNFRDLTGLVTDEDKKHLNKKQILQLEQCEKYYNDAKAKNDYVGMNRAHDSANRIRYSYDKDIYDKDNYDYTHDNQLIEAGSFTVTDSVKVKYVYLVKTEEIARAQSINDGDFVCVDDRNSESNPNIKIIDSYDANSEEVEKVVNILQSYEKSHPTNWERSTGSLISEWEWHNKVYAVFAKLKDLEKSRNFLKRTRDVDLDNLDESTFPANGIPKVMKYF